VTRGSNEEPGIVARVERLDHQRDAVPFQLVRRKPQIFHERLVQRQTIGARTCHAGEAIDPWTLECRGIFNRAFDAVLEFADAIGQTRDASVARGPIACRQIEKHLRKLMAP
jgi:hypothetical protein